jgi:hypothetical protein
MCALIYGFFIYVCYVVCGHYPISVYLSVIHVMYQGWYFRAVQNNSRFIFECFFMLFLLCINLDIGIILNMDVLYSSTLGYFEGAACRRACIC